MVGDRAEAAGGMNWKRKIPGSGRCRKEETRKRLIQQAAAADPDGAEPEERVVVDVRALLDMSVVPCIITRNDDDRVYIYVYGLNIYYDNTQLYLILIKNKYNIKVKMVYISYTHLVSF
jgi:hypothetical protein